MSLSRRWSRLWLLAFLTAFVLNRASPEGRPLGLALMLGLSGVHLAVFAHHLWHTGLLALAMTAACPLSLGAAADQWALVLGWWSPEDHTAPVQTLLQNPDRSRPLP